MPYANNQGIHIRYEVEGSGPPMVLHHGFGGFSEIWYDIGFVDEMKDDYQLILMDARGCGASDKPHDREAYRLAPRVQDVVAVLDDLGLAQAHFHGYSMGGYIGWGIAQYASERFLSLILGGSGPPIETWDEAEAGSGPMQKTLRLGLDAWLVFLEGAFGRWWQPQWKDLILASDIEAFVAMASLWEGIDYQNIIPALTLPCLLYVGENDEAYLGAKEASEILPNATFLSWPDIDHIEAGSRPDLVIPHIRKFLAKVESGF